MTNIDSACEINIMGWGKKRHTLQANRETNETAEDKYLAFGLQWTTIYKFAKLIQS